MRSLSPGPRWYSSVMPGACGSGFLSSLAAARGANVSASMTASDSVMSACFFMDGSSVLIGGSVDAAAPIDERPRQRLTLQRIGVDGVSGVAGGANRDAQRRREFVVLNARDEAIDHACRVIEVRVEEHDRERA